jgi:biopolymer transport protein ExbD
MGRRLTSEPLKADPNLTPLLDVVLQLVMFFMISVNFVAQQFNVQDVKLPKAQSARPLDPAETDILILNINSKGEIVQLPKAGDPNPEPISEPADIRYFINEQAKHFRALAAERGDRSGKLTTLVIIRASENTEYQAIYQVLRYCKDAGFTRLQLRAFIENR